MNTHFNLIQKDTLQTMINSDRTVSTVAPSPIGEVTKPILSNIPAPPPLPPSPRLKPIFDFTADQIITVHETVRVQIIRHEGAAPLSVRYTANNKAVIKQLRDTSCTAASSAMLCLDHGGRLDADHINEIRHRGFNLGKDAAVVCDIQLAGLTPRISKMQSPNVDLLKTVVDKYGPGAIGMDGHSFIVDEITDTSVTIRDPISGKEITVTRKAFQDRYVGRKTYGHVYVVTVVPPPADSVEDCSQWKPDPTLNNVETVTFKSDTTVWKSGLFKLLL
jgi:hypothetical protein